MTSEDRCARCGHPRWHHIDFHGKPRSCCSKDRGEQCRGFVEPMPDTWRRRADELAQLVADILKHECAVFPSNDIIRRALAAGVVIPKHMERYI